jgi:hypothetical protein
VHYKNADTGQIFALLWTSYRVESFQLLAGKSPDQEFCPWIPLKVLSSGPLYQLTHRDPCAPNHTPGSALAPTVHYKLQILIFADLNVLIVVSNSVVHGLNIQVFELIFPVFVSIL